MTEAPLLAYPISAPLIAALLSACCPNPAAVRDGPSQGAAAKPGVDAGAQAIQLCPETMLVLRIRGLVARDRLVLQAWCSAPDAGKTEEREMVVRLEAENPAPHFMTDLGSYPPRQKIAPVAGIAGAWDLRPDIAGRRCPSVRVVATGDPPVPARVVPKDGSWTDAVGLLVSRDCALVVAYLGNQAALLRPGPGPGSTLYNVRLSLAEGGRS
jgi:hypothetical protein